MGLVPVLARLSINVFVWENSGYACWWGLLLGPTPVLARPKNMDFHMDAFGFEY